MVLPGAPAGAAGKVRLKVGDGHKASRARHAWSMATVDWRLDSLRMLEWWVLSRTMGTNDVAASFHGTTCSRRHMQNPASDMEPSAREGH